MRYAVRKPKLSWDDDDDEFYWFSSESPAPTVFEGPDDYEDTGLLDEHGNEIVRFVGVLPIGFLADHSED